MNKFAIVTSIKDPASNTMKNCLVEDERFEIVNNKPQNQNNNYTSKNQDYTIYNSRRHPNTTLIITNQNLVDIDDIDSIIPRDNMIIFLSRHASKSKTPTLTSHSTGNFSEFVLLGGKPMEIGNTFPSFQKFYMRNLYEKRSELSEYDLIIEATHHGPTTSVNPMLFIEIGSSEKEWDNKTTASIVCQSVLDTIKNIENNINNYDINIGIGIGGNHYPQKFNELMLFSSVAFGPIISKYNLAFINEKIIKQMRVKSIEKITRIYIDEKGLGKEKEKVLNISRSQELEIIFV